MNRSMYAGSNPFPNINKRSASNENGEGTENMPERQNYMTEGRNGADSVDNAEKMFGRTNPVHTDEQFLPSYGINHKNIKLAEDKQGQN